MAAVSPPSNTGKWVLTSGTLEAINGTLTIQGQQEWTYIGPTSASIGSISPTSGPTAGATSVTVIGAGFTGANTVLFGTVPVKFQFVSDREIIATTKPASAGVVDVRVVTTNDGTTPITPADLFTFIAPPPHASELLGQRIMGEL